MWNWLAQGFRMSACASMQLFFTPLSQALRLVMHLGEPLPEERLQRVQFNAGTLALFFFLPFVMMMWTNGVGASTGMFVPALAVGATGKHRVMCSWKAGESEMCKGMEKKYDPEMVKHPMIKPVLAEAALIKLSHKFSNPTICSFAPPTSLVAEPEVHFTSFFQKSTSARLLHSLGFWNTVLSGVDVHFLHLSKEDISQRGTKHQAWQWFIISDWVSSSTAGLYESKIGKYIKIVELTTLQAYINLISRRKNGRTVRQPASPCLRKQYACVFHQLCSGWGSCLYGGFYSHDPYYNCDGHGNHRITAAHCPHHDHRLRGKSMSGPASGSVTSASTKLKQTEDVHVLKWLTWE